MTLDIIPVKAKKKDGNDLFVVKYGKMNVVHVRAKDEKDAEEKLMFMLIYKLRGITLDYDPESIQEHE